MSTQSTVLSVVSIMAPLSLGQAGMVSKPQTFSLSFELAGIMTGSFYEVCHYSCSSWPLVGGENNLVVLNYTVIAFKEQHAFSCVY